MGRCARRFWGLLSVAVAITCSAQPPACEARQSGRQRGWGYLIDKLIADGIDPARAHATFRDRRVPPFDGLGFALEPRESTSIYRRFRTSRSVKSARGCRDRYDHWFRAAERQLGVPSGVVSAILHVETHCGKNTGRHVVLHRLARLAMAAEPANIRRNIARHSRGLPVSRRPEIAIKVRQRALKLEEMFYPEVLATFRLAERLGIDPLGIRGSGAGAFGLPQFLPSSYLRFAVDGNGDGRVSLYDPADAIVSAANYLAAHGWKEGLTREQQRRVIWEYNHSEAYIDAILYLASRLN